MKTQRNWLITQGVIYAGSMAELYYLWYKDYPQTNFHFFNDNSEWLQMDKMGHFFSSYYLSSLMYSSSRWADSSSVGMNNGF